MAKNTPLSDSTELSERLVTRHIPAGLSANFEAFHANSPADAWTLFATFDHVVPPSRDTATRTVPVIPPPAIHRSVAVSFPTAPASAKDTARNHGRSSALLASAVPPYIPMFTRPPFGAGSAEASLAGSPASRSGDDSVSDVHPAGVYRPSVCSVFRW